MSKPSLLLLFTGLLLWGCEPVERQYETGVSGRVLTNNTQDFPGDTALPVELVEFIGGSGLSGGEAVRQTHYTDELGHFSFSFTADNTGDKWYIRVPHTHTPPLHYNMSTAGGVPVKVGENQNINIELRPVAWLKLHVKNINPQLGDMIRISLGGGEVLQYFGNTDIHYISKLVGNGRIIFPYTVERNNIKEQFFDTVSFLTAFDTTYHLLEY